MKNYTYFINKSGTMEIYQSGRLFAEISDCENLTKRKAKMLFEDIIFERGGVL